MLWKKDNIVVWLNYIQRVNLGAAGQRGEFTAGQVSDELKRGPPQELSQRTRVHITVAYLQHQTVLTSQYDR